MSEQQEEQMTEETNPLLRVLDQIMIEAEESHGGNLLFDSEKDMGVSKEHLGEFLNQVIFMTLSSAEEALGGMGHVLDMDDIGFLIVLGMQVGQKLGAQ